MDISKIAMLVSFTAINGGLLGERKDNEASELVTNTYNVSHRRAKASKYLIDRNHKSVRRVMAASQRCREVVYKYTSPFGDQKTRLLPVKNHSAFKYEIEAAMKNLDEARDEYLTYYPYLVSESEKEEIGLGRLFDSSQYPPVAKIKSLFQTRLTYWPIPEAGHFMAEIVEDAQEEAREGIRNEVEQRLIDATSDLVDRAKKAVCAYANKLEKTKPDSIDGKPDGLIHDSLTGNLFETAKLINSLNLTENIQISKVAQDLCRLARAVPVSKMRSPEYGNETTKRLYNSEAGHYENITEKPLREKGLDMANEILAKLDMLDIKDQEVADMVNAASEYMD